MIKRKSLPSTGFGKYDVNFSVGFDFHDVSTGIRLRNISTGFGKYDVNFSVGFDFHDVSTEVRREPMAPLPFLIV